MIINNKVFSSFSVTNLQEAKKFYAEILGMKVTESEYTLDLLIDGGHKIIAYQKADHRPATFTILNFPVDDIEKECENLKSQGIKFEIYDDPLIKTDEKGIFRGEGPLIAWFKDPFGNILSIIQENPADES